MNTGFGKSLSLRSFWVSAMAAALLLPLASQAQNTVTGDHALFSNTSGSYETADGFYALYSNTTGLYNVAVGAYALYANTTGFANTATGFNALYYNTEGGYNTANGAYALLFNTTGNYNVGNGFQVLYNNTTGSSNTANGYHALYLNTTGDNNTANGFGALAANTTGTKNTANGVLALYNNTTGSGNTADGVNALYFNTTGIGNMANSSYALYNNTTGSYNMASGFGSLYANTTGISNTAYGYETLYKSIKGNWNTAYGLNALYNLHGDGGTATATAGNFNIALGYEAGKTITTGSNNISIGNIGLAADDGVIRIGTVGTHTAAFVAGVNGVTSSNGVPVYINSNGQLGTITSSARFKFDIKSLGATSEKLMDLRPVSFRYKEATAEGAHPLQYGLIAEEVAKVYPDMVQYDKEGKPFTVYYHLLTPMMLNELQKAHRHSEAQDTKMEALTATVQKQSQELAELKQMVQKQSAGTAFKQANPLPIFNGLVLVACVTGAFLVASRTRQSR